MDRPQTRVYDSSKVGLSLWAPLETLWQRRQLIDLLVRRNLTLRYKRSILGLWWTLLNPLFTTLVLYIVFNNVFRVQMIDGASFAPYLLSGILLVSFFTQGVNMSADAVASGGGVLTKVAVPAYTFAVAAAIAAAINFVIGLVPLGVVSALAGSRLSPFSPLTLYIAICLTLFIAGIGMTVSTLYVRYEDVRSIVTLMLMVSMYVSPVFYPKTILSDQVKFLINLNPLTSFLDCFRWAFHDGAIATTFDWFYMSSSGVVMFLVGLWIFIRSWPRTVAML